MSPLANMLVAALGLSASACVVAPVVRHPPPPPPVRVAVSAFDDALGPHGTWVVVARFGRVWRPHPHVVGSAFVPYVTQGQWVSTEHGWVFESEWPWGWAAFHYGRWYLDPLEGWVWVPDDVWGPAWVEWRTTDGYVGWVPLAPPGIELQLPLYRPRWCFVDVHHFHHHEAWRHRVDDERASGLFHDAQPVPRGPDPAWVGRQTGTPVDTVRVGPPPARPLPPPPPAAPRPPPVIGAPPPPPVRHDVPAPPPPAPPPPPERALPRLPSAPAPAPLPPPHRFERPPDRRPEPAQPFRIEPQPYEKRRPLPPAEPLPQPGQPKKRRAPLSS